MQEEILLKEMKQHKDKVNLEENMDNFFRRRRSKKEVLKKSKRARRTRSNKR